MNKKYVSYTHTFLGLHDTLSIGKVIRHLPNNICFVFNLITKEKEYVIEEDMTLISKEQMVLIMLEL